MKHFENDARAEQEANFPVYRRLYIYILLGTFANYVIHLFGVPVIPLSAMTSSWICDSPLCHALRSNILGKRSLAFLSLVITIRVQLIACVALLTFLTVRRFIFSFKGKPAESRRVFLSALIMTAVCWMYFGSDPFSLQWVEEKPEWLFAFLLSVLISGMMVWLLFAVLDLDFMLKVDRKIRAKS